MLCDTAVAAEVGDYGVGGDQRGAGSPPAFDRGA